MPLKELLRLIKEGAIRREDLTIYFDGGEFYITSLAGVICSGNPEDALAEILDINIGEN